MYLPKNDLYESLLTLGHSVDQSQPEVFNDLPAIIFRVDDNTPNLDLDNDILYQDIEVIIDIWAESSVEASNVLSEVEELMRSNYYRMTYSSDVPNIGNLYHIVSRFVKVN